MMEEVNDFVGENQRILDEWRADYVEKNQSLYPDCPDIGVYFTPDGIMNKGDFSPTYNSVGQFRWARQKSGKENELWAKAPIRILFLTKDQNTYECEAWDVKSESFRYRSEIYSPDSMCLDTGNIFYKNLVYSLYGIVQSMKTSRPMAYEDFVNEKALQTVDEQIFARINCKKEAGGSKCEDYMLKNAIEQDEYFLRQQITNLDADIIACFGYSQKIEKTGNRMLNFLNKIGYNFQKEKEDAWIYYDKERNKVAINSYHLCYPQYDYQIMSEAFFDFLQEHPKFIESHRINNN